MLAVNTIEYRLDAGEMWRRLGLHRRRLPAGGSRRARARLPRLAPWLPPREDFPLTALPLPYT